jgi:hypothetical protein
VTLPMAVEAFRSSCSISLIAACSGRCRYKQAMIGHNREWRRHSGRCGAVLYFSFQPPRCLGKYIYLQIDDLLHLYISCSSLKNRTALNSDFIAPNFYWCIWPHTTTTTRRRATFSNRDDGYSGHSQTGI